MSLLSRLFGSKPKEIIAETYEEFRIYAEPMSEGRIYRLAARIELGEGDAMKTHQLIRADTFESEDAAIAASTAKAKQMIDQQGERLFN